MKQEKGKQINRAKRDFEGVSAVRLCRIEIIYKKSIHTRTTSINIVHTRH